MAFKDGKPIKLKIKPLGGFSETDSLRSLVVRESIYSLSYLVNLKR